MLQVSPFEPSVSLLLLVAGACAFNGIPDLIASR